MDSGSDRTEWHSYLRFRVNQVTRNIRLSGDDASVIERLKDIIAVAERSNERVRIVGSGHSFSDVLSCPDVLVSLGGPMFEDPGLNYIQPISREDRERRFRGGAVNNEHLVSVGAGALIKNLNSRLESLGLALINMGTFNGQTLMGAASTSTHGSGVGLPPFPDIIRSLVLVATSEEGPRVYRIEPADGPTNPASFREHLVDELIQDDDVFYSAIVSMGCMGIVVSAVIEVMDMYWLRETTSVGFWDEARDQYFGGSAPLGIHALLRSARHVEFVVAPHRDHGVEFSKNRIQYMLVKREITPSRVRKGCQKNCFGWLVETIIDRDYAKVYDMPYDGDAPGCGKPKGNAFPSMFNALDNGEFVAPYYDVFAQGGYDIGGYAIEASAPIDIAGNVMDVIIDEAEKNRERGHPHTGPIGVRFVKASNAYLSPHFGRDSATFEVTMLRGSEGGREALAAVEKRLAKWREVRLHWGLQMAVVGNDRGQLTSHYPRWDRWRSTYERFNRTGVFDNALTDRLGISMRRRSSS